MNQSSTITPQVAILSAFLALTWGFYFAFTVREWLEIRRAADRRRNDVVANFRRMVVALCVWMLPVSFLLRTVMVLAGFGNEIIGIVLFFSLAGTNVLGSIFVALSIVWREDD